MGSCLTLPSSESTPKFCGPESVPLNPSPFQISKLERGLFLWRGTCPYSPFNLGAQRGSIPDPMYPHPYVNVKAITQMNDPHHHHPHYHYQNKKQTSNSPRH